MVEEEAESEREKDRVVMIMSVRKPRECCLIPFILSLFDLHIGVRHADAQRRHHHEHEEHAR